MECYMVKLPCFLFSFCGDNFVEDARNLSCDRARITIHITLCVHTFTRVRTHQRNSHAYSLDISTRKASDVCYYSNCFVISVTTQLKSLSSVRQHTRSYFISSLNFKRTCVTSNFGFHSRRLKKSMSYDRFFKCVTGIQCIVDVNAACRCK